MADERQQSDWIRAAVNTAWAINRNGHTKPGSAVMPRQIIPPAFRPPEPPPRELTPEELEAESRRAWGLLATAFGRG